MPQITRHPNRFASVLVPNQGRSEENSKSMGVEKEAGIGKPWPCKGAAWWRRGGDDDDGRRRLLGVEFASTTLEVGSVNYNIGQGPFGIPPGSIRKWPNGFWGFQNPRTKKILKHSIKPILKESFVCFFTGYNIYIYIYICYLYPYIFIILKPTGVLYIFMILNSARVLFWYTSYPPHQFTIKCNYYPLTSTTMSETHYQLWHVHLAYNPFYLACFFSRNSIFLSQKISQRCFSADL
jgi:hypothetical protein